jgi:hypothetical protein
MRGRKAANEAVIEEELAGYAKSICNGVMEKTEVIRVCSEHAVLSTWLMEL